MRILYVASRFPYPTLQGDRVRAYQQLRILSEQHQITLVAPIYHTGEWDHVNRMRAFCERIEPIPVARARRMCNLRKGFTSRLPWQTLYYCDRLVQERVAELLHNVSFDLMHVQLARMGPVGTVAQDVPKVIDLVDSLSLNWHRRAQRERPLIASLVRWEARRLLKYERELTRMYDRVVVCSPIDREFIGCFDNVHVIANGVDLNDFCPGKRERRTHRIVFTGRLGYYPNADAVSWFALKVFPLIREHEPKAEFFIVGADVPHSVQRLEEIPGVVVTGFVPRIQDYLASAGLAIAPMRAGSGMQFKVLEAMAAGTAVVATPYALGGFEARDGEHLLVGEDEESFARHVIHLMREPALARQLGRNGRRLVEEKYTWQRSVQALQKVYELTVYRERGRNAAVAELSNLDYS